MKILNSIRIITVLTISQFIAGFANAQLVNCNAFLQGNYVEVGININGAFGSSENAPAGYHARSLGSTMQNTCTGACSGGGNALGFVADPAKDGWTVGSPNYVGDYFLPGFPQEGWSVEVNGVQGNGWNGSAGCSAGAILFTGGVSGTNVGYSGTGPVKTATWQGSSGTGLAITQVTTLDTSKVFFTMYVTLKNTTGSTLSNVYYMRTVDPDNEVAVPGITMTGYTTINTVAYQLPNALNATLVSAVGLNFGAYLGLGTLDCRAKCFIYPPALEPGPLCDVLYGGAAAGTLYTGTHTGDECIGIVFNLGNIAPGDSATFGYAYVLSSADLLAALHSTTAGWTSTIDTSGHASKDTSYICANTLDTLTITNPGTYDWTWIPTTGGIPLSTYTGTTTSFTLGTTPFTVMAVGTGVCITPDTVFMTIVPKGPGTVTAGSNSPLCVGGTLNLTSTAAAGATFLWTGPSSFTSTLQNPSIPSATTAASGIYTVTASLGTGCSPTSVATTVTVTSSAGVITGDLSVCVGATTPLADTASGGTWSSSLTSIATVGSLTGVVTGINPGTTTITYSTGASCSVTAIVTVNAVSGITGTSSICVGALDTLHGGGICYGGGWISTTPAVATVGSTGIVTGVSPGVTVIEFFLGAIPFSTFNLTVNPTPAAITPTGAVSVCIGQSTPLGETASGGTWTSSNSAIATVTSGGVVWGAADGSVNITYGTPSCYVIKLVTVIGPVAIVPHDPSICVGSTISLTDATPGGTWSGTVPGIATVSSSGVVTATGIGSVGVYYSFGGCIAADTVTITAGAGTISPSGGVSLCAGASMPLADGTPGGVWTSGNAATATVGSTGIVYGVNAGVVIISYTVGACVATESVTVNPGPVALAPVSAAICAGTTMSFTEATGGGIWTSSAPGVATVVSGTVTGLAAGTATISYSIGSCIVSAPVTVAAAPAAITPLTAVSVCVGSTAPLGESTPGGTWSSGTTAIATVSASGVVTGVSVGAATISYTAGGCSVTKIVNVVTGPGPISPSPLTVCMGSPTAATDGTGGGIWSTGNPFVATITSGGVITGVAVGSTNISYSLGACLVTAPVTVANPPAAITATGATSFCAGSGTTLNDATSGGVWSSGSAAIATVSTGGIVTGLTAGTATISYSVGSCYAMFVVTVTPGPSPIAPASSTICTGASVPLTETVSGGVWTSTAPAVATVSATGSVTGLSVGTATISYSLGSCITTATVSVSLSASAAPITGPSSECVGASAIVLSDLTAGGTWSSSSTAVATVSSAGVVTGVTGGVANISYTVINSCGTSVATHMVTINTSPSGGGIVGPGTICAGTFTTLTDIVAGGTWHSSNGTASITSGGLLTGITPGTDTITYTVVAPCGTASAQKIIIIGPFLTAGFISGPTSVCQGAHINLTDPASGGVWSSFNTTIATVNSTGMVTGVNVGIDTIFYTVTTACGSARASYTVTVNSSSVAAGTITGPSGVCSGSSISLADGVAGGTWSVSNAHAIVTGAGSVTGMSVGVDTIRYTVTGVCGSAVSTHVVTISLPPTAGTITGPGTVCAGATIPLTDATGGGLWSSGNANATVGSTTGIVGGVTAGTDVITYTVSNACGTATTTKTVTIDPTGTAGTITGPDTVCIGSAITLTGAVGGGVWTSGSANATVGSSTGVVIGITGGSAPITYTVTTSCGTATSVRVVYITSLPSVGVISGIPIVCLGSGITWTATIPGGTWSASNPHAAIVAPGIIDGVTLGVDTIFYSVSGGCGVASASKLVSVDPVPSVTPIIGPTTHCLGGLLTLTDATPDGVWTTANPTVATIGLTTGVSMGVALGVATLSYTVTNIFGCPTSVTIQDTVVVGPVVPSITGSSSVCFGATVTLSDALAGGTWSSSSTFVASVDPSSGAVTGNSVGTATITYTVENSCGASYVTRTEVVNPLPSVGAITGNANQCVGASTTLSDVTIGGVWSSSDTTIAKVNATTGVVTGIAAGSTTINYTYTNAFGCGYTVSITDNVFPPPFIEPIIGAAHECVGSFIVLGDPTTGGTWSSVDPAIATVSATGVVTGVSGGVATIVYSVTDGCTGSVTIEDTVFTPPAVTPITGVAHVCVGSTTALFNIIPLGIWASGNEAIATVDGGTGVVTGVNAGTDKIYYTVSNGCGPGVTDSITITVYALPAIGPVSAAFTTLCAGSEVHLSDAIAGGVWSSSNTTIATVTSTGVVTGVSDGIVAVRYTVTNSNGCANTASIDITVSGTMPSAELLPSGTATLCRGHSIYMHVVSPGSGLTYQWLQNGVIIPGATTLGYTTYTTSLFSVVVSNGVCNVTLTDTVVIMSPPNPVIAYTPPNILYTSSFVSYQWYLDWVAIPGATTSMIHETSNGVYHVVVTDINGCSDTSGQYSVVVVSGVNTIVNAADIKVYPNPASSVLHVDAPVKVNVTILGADGKVLIDQKDAGEINISGLANGMYLIMVYDENKLLLKTTKFAKVE